ncbi:MAG: selenocysteine-specific translation elongation factor, partial [Chloroflexota bacterium]
MFVIGTAGHVDHGKSSLVLALTGINPDRLREEQEREMTIDLGFAWMALPSGREISIVDVPGHEDFIKNMLAGVGGIDAALFVVAADEAVMPQTREHLAILDLLQVSQGIVALTKADLVQDPEWLALVGEEVRGELADTALRDAPIIPVSAHTGQGLDLLRAELDRLLDHVPPRADLGRPRLPIDRVFTIAGFGTVVTGTLSDGRLRVNDEVQVVPGAVRARVRGLQTHRTKLAEALPGTRVAANLSGVSVDDLQRGQVVVHPGTLEPTTLLDARLRLVKALPWPLKHSAEVDFYSGAARVSARVRLLDVQALEPGQVGWAQFQLDEPIAVAWQDHYIIRLASPSITLGGGQIVQPHPGRRHRRMQASVIQRLAVLAQGRPEDLLLRALERERLPACRDLINRSGIPADDALDALNDLARQGRALFLSPEGTPPAQPTTSPILVVAETTWAALLAHMRAALGDYHRRYPLRVGMPREELVSRLGLEGVAAGPVFERAGATGVIALERAFVRLAEHRVILSPELERQVERVLRAFRQNPATPPSPKQVEQELGADLMQGLIEAGRLVRVSEDVLLDAETFASMRQRLVAHLQTHGKV